MATVATEQVKAVPRPFFSPIIERKINSGNVAPIKFDPDRHLVRKMPTSKVMMKDMGFPEDRGVSPVAVSEPFKLFTQEAIEQMRAEIFNPQMMKECGFKSHLAPFQLRGYAKKYGPFTYDAWNHPETLAILSKIAEVDLIPAIDYEIGHINFSVKSDQEVKAERDTISKQQSYFADDEGIGGCPWEDDKPVVGWHTDSYPFVCVLMLSDCTNMVGGETALQTASGEIMKVRGPEMGCAVVLQGRYITHQALRALGAQERITSVTSFRPKSPHLPDDSVLTTVRIISDLSELYYDFGEYRLEMLEERIRAQLKQMKAARRAGKKCDTKALKKFLKVQEAFVRHTDTEMHEEDQVEVGHISETDVAEESLVSDRSTKRARLQ